MTNEQKWLLKEMYDEGYRDIKIEGVYAFFVNPTFIENGGNFKVRDHTPRIPCRVLGLSPKTDKYSIASLLGIVEWEKVPVDTPIIVKKPYGECKRYFSRYSKGAVWYYNSGATSWSNGLLGLVTRAAPCDVRLAENERN